MSSVASEFFFPGLGLNPGITGWLLRSDVRRYERETYGICVLHLDRSHEGIWPVPLPVLSPSPAVSVHEQQRARPLCKDNEYNMMSLSREETCMVRRRDDMHEPRMWCSGISQWPRQVPSGPRPIHLCGRPQA